MPNLPVPGVTTSWGDDLNAAIESLHLTGTHAARPTTGLVTGTLYSCSDHNLIYRWDGSAWVTWASINGVDTSSAQTVGGTKTFAEIVYANKGVHVRPNPGGQAIVRFLDAVGATANEYNAYSDGNFYFDHPRNTGAIIIRSGTGFTARLSIHGDGRVVVDSGDVEVATAGAGVILKAPNGTRYRLTVSNTGTLVTTAI